MKKIIAFLNTAYASWICILLALSVRIIQVAFVSFIGRDKAMQLLMAKNYLEGNGFTITKYFIQNPDQPYFDPAPMWPPGYSFIMAILFRLFKSDYYLSVLVFETVVAALFIWSFRRLCKQLRFPKHVVNLMTLVAGAFHYVCFIESYVTDGAALAFLLFAFTGCLSLLQRPEDFSKAMCIGIGVLLAVPAVLRYMYVPVVILLPFYLINAGFSSKQKQLLQKALITGATTIILVFGMMLWIKYSSGRMGYIKETGSGIFPGNFLYWHPALLSSFFNTNFAGMQISKLTHIRLQDVARVFEILGMVLSAAVIALLVLRRKKVSAQLKQPVLSHFFKAGILLTLAIYIVLITLTLTNKPQEMANGNWNYIYGARYYAFVHVFVQLCFVALLVHTAAWKKILFYKVTAWLLILVLSFETLHGIYFSAKVALHFADLKSKRSQEHDYRFFVNFVKQLQQENPRKKIIAASTDEFFMSMAVLMGEKGVYDPYELNIQLPQVREECILIAAINEKQTEEFRSFLSQPDIKYLSTQSGVSFYMQKLPAVQ